MLELAPTPADGAALEPEQIAKLLAGHRIRRLDVETVRAALAEAPLHVAPGAVEAATAHIKTLIPRLRVTLAERSTCQREMARLLDEVALEGKRDQALRFGASGRHGRALRRAAVP